MPYETLQIRAGFIARIFISKLINHAYDRRLDYSDYFKHQSDKRNTLEMQYAILLYKYIMFALKQYDATTFSDHLDQYNAKYATRYEKRHILIGEELSFMIEKFPLGLNTKAMGVAMTEISLNMNKIEEAESSEHPLETIDQDRVLFRALSGDEFVNGIRLSTTEMAQKTLKVIVKDLYKELDVHFDRIAGYVKKRIVNDDYNFGILQPVREPEVEKPAFVSESGERGDRVSRLPSESNVGEVPVQEETENLPDFVTVQFDDLFYKCYFAENDQLNLLESTSASTPGLILLEDSVTSDDKKFEQELTKIKDAVENKYKKPLPEAPPKPSTSEKSTGTLKTTKMHQFTQSQAKKLVHKKIQSDYQTNNKESQYKFEPSLNIVTATAVNIAPTETGNYVDRLVLPVIISGVSLFLIFKMACKSQNPTVQGINNNLRSFMQDIVK